VLPREHAQRRVARVSGCGIWCVDCHSLVPRTRWGSLPPRALASGGEGGGWGVLRTSQLSHGAPPPTPNPSPPRFARAGGSAPPPPRDERLISRPKQSLRRLDLHFRCDLLPGRDLAGEPGPGLVHRLRRHDVEVLPRELLVGGLRQHGVAGGL